MGSDLFLVDLDDDVASLEPLLGAGAAVLHLGDNHALGRLVEGEAVAQFRRDGAERKAERLQVLRIGLRRGRGGRSEEHTSELQSLMRISYAVFCLKKKTKNTAISLLLLTRDHSSWS